MKHQLWVEGHIASGSRSHAQYLGNWEGKTLKDSVISYRDSLTDEHSINCVDIENMSFWGCKFFDNEKSARESFG